jgi:hypothetical protein
MSSGTRFQSCGPPCVDDDRACSDTDLTPRECTVRHHDIDRGVVEDMETLETP